LQVFEDEAERSKGEALRKEVNAKGESRRWVILEFVDTLLLNQNAICRKTERGEMIV
jgi:hypothetical protein